MMLMEPDFWTGFPAKAGVYNYDLPFGRTPEGMVKPKGRNGMPKGRHKLRPYPIGKQSFRFAATILDFWLKILGLAEPNSLVLGR